METSKMFAEFLESILENNEDIRSVMSYREAGLLTSNDGVVVRMEDGSQFQIQVVQSERPRRDNRSKS